MQFLTRRELLALTAAGLIARPKAYGAAFPVHFRKPNPYESILRNVVPGSDSFAGEKFAAEAEARLNSVFQSRRLPFAPGLEGASPAPVRWKTIAADVLQAEFNPDDRDVEAGFHKWLESLGTIRGSRFAVLPGNRVRFEISSSHDGKLEYRVGYWHQVWRDGRISSFRPLEEVVTFATKPLFVDATSDCFAGVTSYREQLLRGVPYWRSRLDAASGIDVYGNNGIAVGDIDGDGCDEIYVCQPGGLPNRLFKNHNGRLEDITEAAGVDVLDDTSSALFIDFRNIGCQDLLIATVSGPQLFLNDGKKFRYRPEAFRFDRAPQGTFTGMAAADYDRDGRVDVYFCTYIYYQSEDQYTYPVPYHDAQNGPPNFLFRNELTSKGDGFFRDVTAAVGLNQNNSRFSFAAGWCDFDGNGWPDLYVANDFGRNNLYRNIGGRFSDIAADAGVEDIGAGMSACWSDLDRDGRWDLYVGNMWSAAGQRVVSDKNFAPATDTHLHAAYRRHAKGNSLFRNRGDGKFDELDSSGAEMGRWAWSSDALDFDNDGSPEIYISCGMLTGAPGPDLMSFFWRQVVARSPTTRAIAPEYENGWNAINQLIREGYSWNGAEPNVLYARRGDKYFDLSGISGADFAEDTRAYAALDLDGDGSLDLILKSRMGPQVRVLLNDWGTTRRSIVLELRGTRSNRDAIGAEAHVRHAGGRSSQFVRAGSGYLSQHTKTLHFGLGDSEVADSVRIVWPSGSTQEFANLSSGYRYRIEEGKNELSKVAFLERKPPIRSDVGVAPDNTPAFAPTWLLEPLPLPDKREGPGFVCLIEDKAVAAPARVPFRIVDLRREPEDVAASYALFRRYLFDHRVDMSLPMLFLVDGTGRAHKFYPEIPDIGILERDLKLLQEPNRARLALPFSGHYYTAPHRNHFKLGAAMFWAGYPEQALIYMNETLRLNPGNAKAHLAVGHIHLQAGRHDQSREHLDRASELNPNSPEVWSNLGSLELSVGNDKAAINAFQKALALNPDSAFALAGAGQAYARAGDAQSAERMYRRSLEVDPQNADAADKLGLLLTQLSRFQEARDAFQQAIRADKRHVSAINNLGVLYAQTQKLDDAIAAFRYGIGVDPQNEMLYLNLARAFVQAGDRQRAQETVEELLGRKPDSELAQRALHELAGK